MILIIQVKNGLILEQIEGQVTLTTFRYFPVLQKEETSWFMKHNKKKIEGI